MTEPTGTTVLGEELETQSTDSTQQTDISTTADQQNVDYLASLVGEGKQYSTVEEAASGLAKKAAHADQFIETLKTEKQTLEEQIASSRKIDDILAVLKQEEPIVQAPPESTTVPQSEDVRTAVERLLKEKEDELEKKVQLDSIEKNQARSWELLTAGYEGNLEAAKAAVKEYIGGDKIKADIVNQLGSYKPEELARFITAQKTVPKTPNSLPSRRVTTEFQEAGGLTWSKAKEIKKQDKKLYKSHKFQQALHNAAALNSNFFNE